MIYLRKDKEYIQDHRATSQSVTQMIKHSVREWCAHHASRRSFCSLRNSGWKLVFRLIDSLKDTLHSRNINEIFSQYLASAIEMEIQNSSVSF